MNTADGPAFPLAEVHEAARRRRVSIGGPSFKADLIPHLGGYVRMTEFSEAVLQELRDDDFMRRRIYEGVTYDSYGVSISPSLQEEFAIQGLETWYVKFTMDRDDDGGLVVMASLHKPEGTLRRVGGSLPIRFTRRR